MLILNHRILKCIALNLLAFFLILPAHAATAIPFTITMSEAVNVTGSPRIAVDVGGVTRYATYASGTGTSSLTFTYAAQAGDVDLDGVTLSSPIDLNGGTITDLNGNPETDLTFTVPDTSGIKIDYPSLSMDFIADADGRYTLNGTAYNDLPAFLSAAGGTFARNSVGTYYDSDGVLQTASANQPRFDHDPVTHAPKGILIEESRTNLLNNTDILVWSYNPADISVAAGSGMSGFPSVIVSDISTTVRNSVSRSVTGAINVTYTVSLFVKKDASYNNSYAIIRLRYNDSTYAGIFINPALGAASNYSSATNITVKDYGQYWRFSFNALNVAASPNNIEIFPAHGTVGGASLLGSIEIAAPQLEQGAFPTSYIPTTTAAVTRQADSLSFNTSGWFNANEGQLFSSVNPAYSSFSNYPQIALFGDGTSTNFIAYTLFPGNNFSMEWKQSSSTLYNLSGGNVSAGSETKLIGAYKNNSSIVVKNGATVSTSAATINSLPITLFSIGSNLARGGSDGRYSGTISNLKYYPVRTTNPQLQLLTQ